MSKRQSIPLGYDPDPVTARSHLNDLLLALNPTKIRRSLNRVPLPVKTLALSARQMALRNLVNQWTESGPNLRKLLDEHPRLARAARKGRTRVWPTAGGRGHLEWIPSFSDHRTPTADELAISDFLMLVTNPSWRLLAGPCKGCDLYFIKKTTRKRVYCSKTCSSHATALASVRKKRDQVRLEKIAQAQAAIDLWAKARRDSDWKYWVSSETGYSVRWLTRVRNEERLRLPAHVTSIGSRRGRKITE